MWLVIGLILIFAMAKENKIFYLAGGYFLFLGTWRILEQLFAFKMFTGPLGIVFKVVSAAVFLILVGVFVKGILQDRKKGR